MSLIKYHQKCRVCGHNDLKTFFNLGEHYLHGLFVFPDFQPPTGKVPTELARCHNATGGCGLVQLKHSVDPAILYSRYGYRSSTNATMRAHLTNIALEAESLWNESFPVDSPACLDIGCNDGFLLRQYSSNIKKVGIDPCDIGRSIEGIENFTFINDIFPSKKLAVGTDKFDIITMIACFYDLDEPVEVAERIRWHLSPQGFAVVEVSYWPAKMAQNAIDEVCHEHVCFYNFQDLENVFNRAGLKIFNVKHNSINGGSIQVWLSKNDSPIDYSTPEFKANILKTKFDEFNLRLDSDAPYDAFKKRCDRVRNDIWEFFDERALNKNVHLYGASTKGNVLLQYLELDNRNIPYAAERSKEKWGGKTLGTNIQMISEEESRAMRPDYYFVPIWSFREEIIRREKSFLDAGGKLVFPFPKFEVVEQK